MLRQGEDGEAIRGDALRPGPALPRPVDPNAYADSVLAVADLIPAGRVLTYGDVAELLACGGPRQVGRVLSRSTQDVPWWRVLRAGGHPPRGLALRARAHYDDEGTALTVSSVSSGPEEYRIDLVRARWWPSEAEQVLLSHVVASWGRTASDGGTPLRSR